MELEHSFTVPVPKDRAWDVLLDVERVAPCMPGATLDSVDGDEIHGKIKVKVGPITQIYAGTARFTERDPVAGVVSMQASGKETRGAGTASASVRSVLEDRGNETHVTVLTKLNVTGKPAQFGRGVMNEVGGKLLNMFAANLAATLAEPEAPAGARAGAGAGALPMAGPAPAAAATPAPGATPVSEATPAPVGAAADAAATEPAAGGPDGSVVPAVTASPAVSLDAPIDDLALPARLRAVLRRGGITTIGELVARTSEDLLKLAGVGPGSVEDIKAKLAKRGLTLGHPPAPGVATGGAPAAAPAALAGAIQPGPAPAKAIPPGPAPAEAIPAAPAPAGAIPPVSAPTRPTALPVNNGAAPDGATGAATTTAQPRPAAAKVTDHEHEAINLLKVAGMPILKRALPVLAGLTAALVIALRHRLRHRKSSS